MGCHFQLLPEMGGVLDLATSELAAGGPGESLTRTSSRGKNISPGVTWSGYRPEESWTIKNQSDNQN